MLNALLPRNIDNAYPGRKPGLWLFALLVLVKAAMALNSIFNGYVVATSADGIPLDTFTPGGAQAVVSLFAIWGLAQLVLCLLGVLALVRYRAMVPLLFALLLLEHVSRRLILTVLPIPRAGTTPASGINVALMALMILGLALSVWTRKKGTSPIPSAGGPSA